MKEEEEILAAGEEVVVGAAEILREGEGGIEKEREVCDYALFAAVLLP